MIAVVVGVEVLIGVVVDVVVDIHVEYDLLEAKQHLYHSNSFS